MVASIVGSICLLFIGLNCCFGSKLDLIWSRLNGTIAFSGTIARLYHGKEIDENQTRSTLKTKLIFFFFFLYVHQPSKAKFRLAKFKNNIRKEI